MQQCTADCWLTPVLISGLGSRRTQLCCKHAGRASAVCMHAASFENELGFAVLNLLHEATSIALQIGGDPPNHVLRCTRHPGSPLCASLNAGLKAENNGLLCAGAFSSQSGKRGS